MSIWSATPGVTMDEAREMADVTEDRDPYPCKVCRTVTADLNFSDECERCEHERIERTKTPLP